MRLHNIFDSKVLKERLLSKAFTRKIISFYRYFILDQPQEFRNQIYQGWKELDCFGRIYVAREGINAQMSVPEHNYEAFLETLIRYPIFSQISIKFAIEDNVQSFYKLTIKVRPKLVADGLDDHAFDVTNVGQHLDALEFHKQVESGEHLRQRTVPSAFYPMPRMCRKVRSLLFG